MSGDDRDRGILSTADREYLRGEREFGSEQAERNARARVRDRVYEALLDFELLVEHLSERDRELVFADRVTEGGRGATALLSAVAFLYRGVGDTDVPFETVLAEGISLAEADDDRSVTVDFELTFDALRADRLREKLREEGTLTLAELAYLRENEPATLRELAALLDDEDVDDGRVQSELTNF